MSDFVPGTLFQMRIDRRFSHYTVGEMIAVPYEAARDLEARRLATPLHALVPLPRPGADDAAPARQPTGVVRK